MRRVFAALAAVAMVVGALALRASLGDGDDPAAPPSSPVLCAADLAAICEEAGIGSRAEPAGATADRLVAATSADELEAAAWLTTSAWASLVVDERARLGREPLFAVVGAPLASSGVAAVAWSDRQAQLAQRCGQPADAELGWRCVAEAAGATLAAGDRVRVAIPDVDSAAGLVVAASQAAGLLGRADFASNDFDGAFRTLATGLADGQTADPLRQMRGEGPGQVTVAGALLAGARTLTSSFGTLQVNVPDPAVRADVVLVAARSAGIDDRHRAQLAGALRAAGFEDPAGGDGLPAGGVLAAIRTLWAEAR
ncbi:MAG TPA: hypothetical protein VFU14_09595 [Acidimicrobiales bacterium]|nr:hypothetical protein [Acidimicrobiales bacterium]